MKMEKREDKHPLDENQVHTNVDFQAESKKFNKLIEVLSKKLNEKPGADLRPCIMPLQMENKNEKKGDKTDMNPYIELHRRV